MNVNDFFDRVTMMRVAGHSWDDINAWMAEKQQAAIGVGYDPKEVDSFLGFEPGDIDERLRAQAVENIRVNTPKEEPNLTGLTSQKPMSGEAAPLSGGEAFPAPIPVPEVTPWEAFTKTFRNSVSGLLVTGSMDPTSASIDLEHAGFASRLAAGLGAGLGDLPAMVVGGIGGGMVGGPIAPATAMGGAFALPAYVKSIYADALLKGQVKGPADYAERVMRAAWEATKGFEVGALTGIAGPAVGTFAKAAGPFAAGMAQFSAEVATMVTTGKALEGQLPTMQDFIDGAAMLAVFKVGYGGARKALADHWVQTGEDPKAAVSRARADEIFRQQLLQMAADKPAPPKTVIEQLPAVAKELAVEESGALPPQPTPRVRTPVEQAADEVASRFGAPGEGEPPVKTFKTTAETAYRQIFNAEHPLTKLLNDVSSGVSLANTKNPLLLMRAAKNSTSVAKFVLEDGQVKWDEGTGTFKAVPGAKGLDAIVKPFQGDKGTDNFWTYVGARWAQERETQGKETGVNAQAANTYVAARQGKYERAFQEFVDWRNSSFEALKDSGFLTEDRFDEITMENLGVPARRIGAGGKEGAGTGPIWNPIKEFRGSDLKVKNLQETIMRQTFARYALAMRNKAVREAYNIAESLGEAGAVKRTAIEIKLTEAELAKLESDLLNDPTFDIDSATIWRTMSQKQALGPNEVVFFDGGKLVKAEFADPNLASFLKGFDYHELSLVGKALAKFHSVARHSITSMPDFPVRMAFWDAQLRFITNPEVRLEVAGTLEGVIRTLVGDKGLKDFQLSGGMGHIFEQGTRDQYIKWKLTTPGYLLEATRGQRAWNAITKANPLRALQWWSNAWYRGAQYGKFLEETRAGVGPLEAGAKGAEASFPRAGGGGTVARAWDQNLIFSNAYLQSLELYFRAQFGIGKHPTSGLPFNPAKATIAGLALITLPTVIQWAMYKDEDWYKALSDFEKDNSFLFRAGDTTFTIHNMPIASFIYGGLVRRVLQSLYEQDPAALTRGLGASLGWSFVPPSTGFMVSNIAAPILGKLSNYNFGTGTPVVPDWMKDSRLPPQQYTNWSSKTARWLSEQMSYIPAVKHLRMNPNEIDMFVSSWLGPMASSAIRWTEYMARSHGWIDPQLPSMKITDLPGFSAWTANYPSASAEPIRRWYDEMAEYQRVFGSMRDAMEKGDVKLFGELAAKNPTMTAMASFDLQGVPALSASPHAREYLAILKGVTGRVNMQSAQTIVRMKKALEAAGTVARLIEAVESPAIRKEIERGFVALEGPGKGTGVEGELTSADKAQLLDRIYIGMMNAAEAGLEALDNAERQK